MSRRAGKLRKSRRPIAPMVNCIDLPNKHPHKIPSKPPMPRQLANAPSETTRSLNHSPYLPPLTPILAPRLKPKASRPASQPPPKFLLIRNEMSNNLHHQPPRHSSCHLRGYRLEAGGPLIMQPLPKGPGCTSAVAYVAPAN
eukprot:5892462-Pyramimonas_sp.AAC.1